MKTNLSFDDAFADLEKLVSEVEDENIPLDSLAEKVKAANGLISYCEIKLRTIAADIEQEMQMNQ